MDTVSRVYALLNERNMSLYQLTRISGVSHPTIKATGKGAASSRLKLLKGFVTALVFLCVSFSERTWIRTEGAQPVHEAINFY